MPRQNAGIIHFVLSLDKKYRIPIHLFYYEGYSIEEIARLMNARPATVGTWLARGRKQLRDMIGDDYLNKNIYRDSMQKLEFRADFDQKTIDAMEKAARKSPVHSGDRCSKSHFKWQYAALPALACTAVAIVVVAYPILQEQLTVSESTVDVSSSIAASSSIGSSESSRSTNVGGEASVPQIAVVDASAYSGEGLDSMAAPKAGEVRFDQEVFRAMEDPATDALYFFVEISPIPDFNATEPGSMEDYVYKGRTISEWQVLVDLANGTYLFDEYNGDHGGKITEEDYYAAITEAKSLDAAACLAVAGEGYKAKFDAKYPDLEALRMDNIETECKRLKDAGFDVRLYETWTYFGKGEKEYFFVLAGLLNKSDLKALQDENANPQLAISVSWVRNGDGLERWDDSKWNQP